MTGIAAGDMVLAIRNIMSHPPKITPEMMIATPCAVLGAEFIRTNKLLCIDPRTFSTRGK
jgi:hypothetical protein